MKRDLPVRVKRWYWTDASSGKTYLQIRYGNKALELAKDKPTIELKNVDELLVTFEKIHKAVADGELDDILMAAKTDMGSRFKRK